MASSNITFNGVTYSIPAVGDDGWGADLSAYFIAIASGALQKTGGNFTLTAEANFGATFGLKSAYVKSQAANPASAGIVRLGNNESISWRNAANNADINLKVNASDSLEFNGASILYGLILNADVDPSAAIALSKLATVTASRVLVSDVSGIITASAITTTTLAFLDATSSIQTQLDAKQARSTLTTKGDLYVATASATTARQGVGSDGTFLKADSTQTNGVIWASVAGSALAVTSKTTTYTATTSDDVILVDTGSAWTLTLYAASGNSGKVLRVVKTSSDTNSLTIDGNASETINGFANIKLNYQFDEVTLVCDGTNWNIISQIKAPKVTPYTTSSGTHTVENGVKFLKIKMVGGGAGGGGAGTANSGGTSGAGGNTTFGTSLLVANGGAASAGFAGGAGGTASLGTGPVGIALAGAAGSYGFFGQSINYVRGSAGSATPFGGGGPAGSATGGAAASNTGAGGAGGSMNSAVDGYAGAGGAGGGYVEAIIYNPSATYGYSVGSGGGGGAAGTTGNAGGAGGSGLIIVEEHF